MSSADEPLVAQLWSGDGVVVAGDLGLIGLKSLLENGVAYLATTQPEPVDPLHHTADAVADSLLAPLGVSFRTTRSLSQLRRAIAGLHSSERHRGALLLPADAAIDLSELAALEVHGALVVISTGCAALRQPNAIALDPAPSGEGLRTAIDAAFGLALATGRPAFVCIREELLEMRGSIVARDNIRWREAQAVWQLPESGPLTTSEALDELGPDDVISHEEAAHAIVTSAALFPAAAAAARLCQAHGITVNVLAPHCATLIPETALRLVAEQAEHCLVVEDDQTRLGRAVSTALTASGLECDLQFATISSDGNRAHAVTVALADWLGRPEESIDEADEPGTAALATALRAHHSGGSDHDRRRVSGRIPPRGASVAAGGIVLLRGLLELVQGAIGIPSRLPGAHRSYQTDAGTFLTIADGPTFLANGIACAHEAARNGVFVIGCEPHETGAVAAEAAQHGSVVTLDSNDLHLSARALAQALTTPSGAMFMVCPASVGARVDRGNVQVGFEPHLQGTDRVSASAIVRSHPDALELGDTELALTPLVCSLDPQVDERVVRGAERLSQAWYRVRIHPRAGQLRRLRMGANRRLLRGLARVEA